MDFYYTTLLDSYNLYLPFNFLHISFFISIILESSPRANQTSTNVTVTPAQCPTPRNKLFIYLFLANPLRNKLLHKKQYLWTFTSKSICMHTWHKSNSIPFQLLSAHQLLLYPKNYVNSPRTPQLSHTPLLN